MPNRRAFQGASHMKELLSVMTRKGQLTVPAEVRSALGLKQGDKVAFVMEGGHARLIPTHSVVAQTAGALRSNLPALSVEKERAAFERGVAAEVQEEWSGNE